MDCLNGVAESSRHSGCFAECFEDMSNDRLHTDDISDVRIVRQAPCYPIIDDAEELSLWQSGYVDNGFDIALVKARMKERKVNQTGLARVMGLPSQSALSNIFSGKRRVTAQEAKIAYDFLGIETPQTIRVVPIIGITNAGNWREAIQMPLGKLPIPIHVASDDAFALEISGDSMDLIIEDGSHIVIDPRDKELRDGKCYLIQNSDGEATVKAYRRSPARFEPQSSNPDHKGWLVAEHDFMILGRVVLKVQPL